MLQLLVALSLSAQAEPVLVDRLQHVGHPPATVAAVCSPVSAVQERFGVTAELLSQLLVEHAPDKKNAAWLDLLDSERASALGLDGAGAVSVHWWEDGGTLLSLPLRTDLSDPQPLIDQLFGPGIEPGPQGWSIPGEDEPQRAFVSNQQLHLVRAHPPVSSEAPAPVPLLFRDLAEVPACAVHFQSPDALRTKTTLSSASALLPLDGGQLALLRVELPVAPEALSQVAGPPLIGDSVARPLMAITLGFDPLELFEDPFLAEKAEISAADLAEVRENVTILPGATVVVFGTEPTPRFAGLVALAKPNGRPMPARRIARFLEAALVEQDMEVSRHRKLVVAEGEPLSLWCTAFRGGVLITSGPEVLEQDLGLGGEPWLTPEQQDWASQWPVAIVTDFRNEPATAAKLDAMGLQAGSSVMGLRSREGGLELGWVTEDRSMGGEGISTMGAYLKQRFEGLEGQLQGLETPATPPAVEAGPEPAAVPGAEPAPAEEAGPAEEAPDR